MGARHILIVEDDDDLAQLLSRDLTAAGYHVHHAGTLTATLTQLRKRLPELVLLDLTLPDGHGREIVLHLRQDSAVPIIVLTADARVAQKVELLLLGADDYVLKPFELSELLVRIALQLRRGDAKGVLTVPVRVGRLVLWPQAGLLLYGGRDVLLTRKEIELLGFLMQQPGRVYARQAIFASVWPDEAHPKTSNVLAMQMMALRTKLRLIGAPDVLRTVRGFGYALTQTV